MLIVFLDVGATCTLFTCITLFQPIQCVLKKTYTYIKNTCLQTGELCRKELSLWAVTHGH